jgi:hypothetical protein
MFNGEKMDKETITKKAIEALDKAIAEIETGKNSTRKPTFDGTEFNYPHQYSPVHLQLLHNLKKYIQDGGAGGPFKINGKLPFAFRNFDYNKEANLGQKSKLVRLRFNLQLMRVWDDKFSEYNQGFGIQIHYPGWVTDLEKQPNPAKPYYFVTDKDFLDNMINSVRADDSIVSRIVSRGGRVTYKNKKTMIQSVDRQNIKSRKHI